MSWTAGAACCSRGRWEAAHAARRALPKPSPPPLPTPAPPPPPPPNGRSGVLAALDPEQAAAAAAPGPLLVIAGPGSGKTRLLTHRLAHLILEQGVPASACLAVTFTRKATHELKTQLRSLLGDALPEVHSFHSLGLSILRAHADVLGLPPDFRIADDSERRSVLAQALGLSHDKAGALLKTLSALKRTGQTGTPAEEQARAVLEAESRAQAWVDLDDLVSGAVSVLDSSPAVGESWRRRFAHIVADEFQDVDESQYRLLHQLAGPGSLCVIGDPHQAIYGFRGADAGCFARFATDWPEAPEVRLFRNYRSSGTIVEAAAALIGQPADGQTRGREEPIVVQASPTAQAEAEGVVATLEHLMGGHDLLAAGRIAGQDRPLSFADVAVLYRTDAQAEAFRGAFDRAGIPYRKSSPAPLAQHPGVRAVLAALETLPPGPPLRECVRAAVASAQGEAPEASRLARDWLVALIDDGVDDLERLREACALMTEADFHDQRGDRVSLLTMHAAKGLEFPVVFVTGLEDGLMPLSWGGASPDPAALAEERRLLYVALTRARDRLILTHARERFWHGAVRARVPSSFLADLPAEFLGRPTGGAPRRARQLTLF
ncbi:ATP-dependent helicase [Pararhodospirillum photometricum]|uniref:ATP-dependent helicase n=1 Tax=Pararhodospirillum photometricum TaxID=1084 RepID=UPI0030DC27C8